MLTMQKQLTTTVRVKSHFEAENKALSPALVRLADLFEFVVNALQCADARIRNVAAPKLVEPFNIYGSMRRRDDILRFHALRLAGF
jgi:hypothetical protein